ncbi:MAG: hypothetical protein B6243_07795 [Anaerolineaceae bacterium 4572_5.2]|nr:MAG: hypothetical protein B6243_07795 [Anaerolineaceae bacterium 4572_5.2]
MTIQQLLHTMCAEISNADLNAIRKARGFGVKETASRTAFASFYVTSLGVVKNMASLTPAEIFTLRLLDESGEVAISFFERLYGTGYSYGTYTQRYRSTLQLVKKNLVRRGLVVMAEVKMRGDTVQMERWRFALPPEFASYLPPLSGIQKNEQGVENDFALRRKLLELLGGTPAILHDSHPIGINDGSILLGNEPYSLATFANWQTTAWHQSFPVTPRTPFSLTPTAAARKLLDTQNWIAPKSLEPALAIYAFGSKLPSSAKLLKKGWELGLLSRLDIDSVPHYRLASLYPSAETHASYPATLKWADTTAKPDALKIDLRLIPFRDLDLLNTLTNLELEDNQLFATPSPIKLGRATPAQHNAPLSLWLAENIPAFKNSLEKVNAKWGKTILHENLFFAKVRDLSLRVQLERKLKENLIILNDNFIAFPKASHAHVEKILKKTGFVEKVIKP